MTTRDERIAALDRATPIVLSIIDQWLGLTQPRQSPDAGKPYQPVFQDSAEAGR